jgi:hypothetical protein
MSADGCPGAPMQRLLNLAESVIHLARQVDHLCDDCCALRSFHQKKHPAVRELLNQDKLSTRSAGTGKCQK